MPKSSEKNQLSKRKRFFALQTAKKRRISTIKNPPAEMFILL
jgi:hypothetical protein